MPRVQRLGENPLPEFGQWSSSHQLQQVHGCLQQVWNNTGLTNKETNKRLFCCNLKIYLSINVGVTKIKFMVKKCLTMSKLKVTCCKFGTIQV